MYAIKEKTTEEIGTGTIDFSMLAEFIRPEHTLVLELSPSLTAEQVVRSRDSILNNFD